MTRRQTQRLCIGMIVIAEVILGAAAMMGAQPGSVGIAALAVLVIGLMGFFGAL